MFSYGQHEPARDGVILYITESWVITPAGRTACSAENLKELIYGFIASAWLAVGNILLGLKEFLFDGIANKRMLTFKKK